MTNTLPSVYSIIYRYTSYCLSGVLITRQCPVITRASRWGRGVPFRRIYFLTVFFCPNIFYPWNDSPGDGVCVCVSTTSWSLETRRRETRIGYTCTCFHNTPYQLYREMGVQLRALVTPVSSIVEARNTFARHCTSTEVATFLVVTACLKNGGRIK